MQEKASAATPPPFMAALEYFAYLNLASRRQTPKLWLTRNVMLRERKRRAKHTVPLVSTGMARVTASPKGNHAQVARHGTTLSRTVLWAQVGANLSPMKYWKPWQESLRDWTPIKGLYGRLWASSGLGAKVLCLVLSLCTLTRGCEKNQCGVDRD